MAGQGKSWHLFFKVLYLISGGGLCYQARCILIGPSKTRGLTCAHLGYVLQTFALHGLLEFLQMKQECTSSFLSQCRLQHDYIAQTTASTDASRRDPQARFSNIFVVHGALVHKKPAIRDPSITSLTSKIWLILTSEQDAQDHFETFTKAISCKPQPPQSLLSVSSHRL